MKKATLISAIITALLMLSTMICGLWIKANNIAEKSSIDFHMSCGIAATIFCLVTLAMVIASLKRR